MRNDDAQTPGVRVVVVSRALVLADKQVLRRRRGGRVVPVSGERRLGRVVRTAPDHLLDVLRLHVDGHRAHDAARRRARRRLEAHRARVRHAHVQLPQRLRVLCHSRRRKLAGCMI